jgi:hypothetical protein
VSIFGSFPLFLYFQFRISPRAGGGGCFWTPTGTRALNEELRQCMGTVVTFSIVLTQVLAGVTEENHKKPWQGYLLPKPEVPEHETGMLTIQPPCWTCCFFITCPINNSTIHDAQKSEFWSQRSVTEVFIAVQWFVKTRFNSNEYMHNSWVIAGGIVLQLAANLLI